MSGLVRDLGHALLTASSLDRRCSVRSNKFLVKRLDATESNELAEGWSNLKKRSEIVNKLDFVQRSFLNKGAFERV